MRPCAKWVCGECARCDPSEAAASGYGVVTSTTTRLAVRATALAPHLNKADALLLPRAAREIAESLEQTSWIERPLQVGVA